MQKVFDTTNDMRSDGFYIKKADKKINKMQNKGKQKSQYNLFN